MSLQTWKEEFYPIPANKTSEEDAINHSLKKWKGLTKENLEKHGLRTSGASIYDDEGYRLTIDSSTCSLCFYYSDNKCNNCPLKKARGMPCDAGASPPYHRFLRHTDPIPMINLLKECQPNVPDEPLLPEFFDPSEYNVVEEKDLRAIRDHLASRSVVHWCRGVVPGTDYYRLVQCSPDRAGSKALVIVCRTEAVEIASQPNSPDAPTNP